MPNITGSSVSTGLGDIGSAISDFGSAAADLTNAQGAYASSGAYVDASQLSTTNQQISEAATAVQVQQQQRQLYQTIGSQRADVGGAGFAESGSALDLMRSSAQQGALAKSLMTEQGAITSTSYLEQSDLYAGMAAAASDSGRADQSAASSSSFAGDVSTVAAVAAFFL